MFSNEWLEFQPPDHVRLIILHPNLESQHRLLSIFTAATHPLLLNVPVSPSQEGLASLWADLTNVLAEQAEIALPPLRSNAPDKAASALLKALAPAGPFTLLLTEFDRVDQNAVGPFIAALTDALPAPSRIVLSGRRMPPAIVPHIMDRSRVMMFPVDPPRMLFDYVNLPEDTTLLEVYAFGQGVVIVNGQVVDRWDGILPRAMFFFLIDRLMVTRDEIFEAFWPGLPIKEATNVFHVTKRKINEILAFDLTRYTGGFYCIAPNIELHYDVVQFKELVQRGLNDPIATREALTHAIMLYQIALLYDLTSDWVNARRHEVAALYVEALTTLARLHWDEHEHERALGLYLRAYAVQPLREDIARNIMQLYELTGKPGQSRRVFQRLSELLQAELGLEPDARTRELFKQIAAAR